MNIKFTSYLFEAVYLFNFCDKKLVWWPYFLHEILRIYLWFLNFYVIFVIFKCIRYTKQAFTYVYILNRPFASFIASQGTNSAKFPGTMYQKLWQEGFVLKGSCRGICILYVYMKRMLKLVLLIKHNTTADYWVPSAEQRRQAKIDAAS